MNMEGLLEKAYPKAREDGSYYYLFGDVRLGKLISAIQSATIRMGNLLEKLITENAKIIDENNINSFFDKTIPDGIYIIPKSVIVKDRRLNFDQVPDVILVLTKENKCIIVEVKLGDNFDTKKSQAEVNNLRKYQETFRLVAAYKISYAICMWNAKNKTAVVNGFKNKITEKEALTGRDFCKMANIDYDEISNKLVALQEENIKFFWKRIKELEG